MGGNWPGPPYASGVADDLNDTGEVLIIAIPGASSDVTVDASGNVLTGIGYTPGPPNRTGEIKLWPSALVWDAIITQNALNYETTGNLLADNVLSSGTMGVDIDGNLHVGGGDAFGGGGPSENGYAALIHHSVLTRVAGGGAKLDESNTGEYKEIATDPCEDDSATSASYGSWGEGLAVIWNPSGNESSTPPGQCYSASSVQDYWLTGVTPVMSLYYPNDAPDTDSYAGGPDGIPNGSDNAYVVHNPGQQDFDGDGWADAADGDFNNDGVVDSADDPLFMTYGDMDSDGNISQIDLCYYYFPRRYNDQNLPWY